MSEKPAVTANTATDREMGFERGLVVAYLEAAIDALVHLKERTGAGRAWLIADDTLEEALQWLTNQRAEVLRKEKVDSRPAAPVEPARVPWTPTNGANGQHPPRPYGPGRRL